MRTRFFVEVDAGGEIISVEEGEASSLPAALLPLLGRFAAERVLESGFIWAPESQNEACQIQVAPATSEDPVRASVYVSGEWLEELPFALTYRELDVLTMLALGLPSGEIGGRLHVSPRTITTHVDRIMRKMGAQSRTAAAVMAVDQGIVRVPLPEGAGEDSGVLRLGRTMRGTTTRGDAARRSVKKPLVIGAALPLRGAAVADGIEMARASQLAVEELNARGGIGGREVGLEIVGIDLFDGDQVRTAFEELIGRGVDVVTSGYLARQDVAHEVIAEARIPYLHAATLDAMTQRVREDSTRYGKIFQVCPSDSNYAPRFVEMMTQLRDRGQWRPSSSRLVIAQGGWEQTDLGIVRASGLAEQHGWDLEVMRLGITGPQGWNDLATLMSSSAPAAVMIGNYLVDDTVSFMQSFLRAPSDTLVYSLYSPSVPEFRERMGDAADGLLWATVTGTYSDAHARAFVHRFRNRFGVNPGRSHAGIAYDRVSLIAHAWQFSANPRDAGLVADELRRVIHRGVNGVYHFGDASQAAQTYSGPGGDPSMSQAHLVFQIQAGKQRILDPDPYADGHFMQPPWFSKR